MKVLPIDIAFISYLHNNTKNPYNSSISSQNDTDILSIYNHINENLSSNNLLLLNNDTVEEADYNLEDSEHNLIEI